MQLQSLPGVAPVVLLIARPLPDSNAGGLFRYVDKVPAGSPASVAELPANLASLPAIELHTHDALTQIRALQLDFVLSFSTAPAHELHEIAYYGVWQFEFGDWETFRGSPPGFWEVYRNAKASSAMLCRLTADRDEVIPLRRGSLSTQQFSYPRNRDQLLSRFTHWPAQVCRDIRSGDVQYLQGEAVRGRPTLNTAPCNKGIARYVIRMAWYLVSRGMRPWIEHDHWNIGLVEQPIEDFVHPQRPRKPIKWLPTPAPGEFVADPFGWLRDEQLTVFCEHLDYGGDAIGTIATLQPNSRAPRVPVNIGPAPRVHLSYPQVFEHEGRLLCIPETQGAREVALYELQRFTDQWLKVATLRSDGMIVDATLFRHGELWWLAGASDPGGAHLGADLHLWYATDLLGPWAPHAANPVKTDVSSARPAGATFVSEGVLYRPAQDSSQTYGGRVVINRVVALTPETFREEPATFVAPDAGGPYPDGLHTLSGVGGMTLVDGKRLAFSGAEFRRVLRRMIMRRLKKLF
ncbi:MAG TPA: hypothetical protein VGI23_15730 [Steroidobacteraceae bacterium]